jgi:hypothetical protein
MAYVYANVENLQSTEMVGSHQCVALVQHYAKVPHTSKWSEGAKVETSSTIVKGTAIATFVDGKYPNKPHGNHAALYISQDASGITVMEQWTGKKTKVSSRKLPFKGKNLQGAYNDPSNNGDAFSIIE